MFMVNLVIKSIDSSDFVPADYDSRKVHLLLMKIVDVLATLKRLKKSIVVPVTKAWKFQKKQPITRSLFDLDLNGRVNTSKYLEWMYDVVNGVFREIHSALH